MTETDWAIRNLELAGFFGKDSDYEGMIGEAVKKLLLVHGAEGHSGASHYRTIQIFELVATGKQALTMAFWNERFNDFNKFAVSQGGIEPLSEIDYEAILAKPPSIEAKGRE